MKNFLFRLKDIYKQIFSYPTARIGALDAGYDEYWGDKRGKNIGAISRWQRERADVILRNIDTGHSFSIMDIGCADGSVLKYIKERTNILKAIGVDVSLFALAKAKEFGIDTIHADANDIKNLD